LREVRNDGVIDYRARHAHDEHRDVVSQADIPNPPRPSNSTNPREFHVQDANGSIVYGPDQVPHLKDAFVETHGLPGRALYLRTLFVGETRLFNPEF
jgi:hypothetical protein